MSQEEKKFSDRVKQHLKENKKVYLVGAGCLAAGYFLRRPKIVPTPVINNTVAPVMQNIGNVVNNTVNNGGHCTKIVQRLTDGELFGQAAEAAYEISEKHDISFDRARWMLSRHLNGHLDDVFGMKYKTVGLGTTG